MGGLDRARHAGRCKHRPLQMVCIVCCNQRQIEILGDLKESLVHSPLLLKAMVLQLDEIAAFVEDLLVHASRVLRLVKLPAQQVLIDLLVALFQKSKLYQSQKPT